MRINSILRQVTVLNGFLLAGILLLAYLIFVRLTTFDMKLPASSIAAATAAGEKHAAEPAVTPPMQDYAVIAEKNLFHPDRIVPAEKKEVTIPRPEFVLYGTLIVDKVRIAYISDKKAQRTTPGRGKRQVGLKIGETLSGYTLKDVLPDGAVMVRGDDRIGLKVISSESKKERGDGGGPAIPGATTAQPARPIPAAPQGTPPFSAAQPAPTGQAPSVQQSPVTPGVMRSRASRGR